MRRAIVFLVLLGGLAVLSWPRSASAQVSIWLQKGVSGAGAAFVVQHDDSQTSYGVNGGYSIRGFLELDFTAAYLSFPDDSLTDDLQGYVVIPRVEVHPLKQSQDIPVSLGIGAGAAKFFLLSDQLDDMGISIDSWNVNFDAAVYRFFKIAPSVGITPAVGVGYVHSWATASQRREERTATDDSFSGAIGTYLAFLDGGGRIWGIAPSVSVDDDGDASISLRAGLVWPL